MKIKILIVEDEVLVAEDLSDSLIEYGFKVCGSVISGDACRAAIKLERPDIVILDINIRGELDGIELARILNQMKIPFIFLTANNDIVTVTRALPLQPAAFISKPFNKQDLKVAIELVCQKQNKSVLQSLPSADNIESAIFVKEGAFYKRIEISNILYIEAKGSYSMIVTPAKSYTLSYNLNYFTTHVKHPAFKKIHRSYIINIHKVEGFDTASLVVNKTTLPVSKQHQKEIMAHFLKL